MKSSIFFPSELKLNLNVGASNFAVPWEQDHGLTGRIHSLSLTDVDDDDDCQPRCRKKFTPPEDISQGAYDQFFSSDTPEEDVVDTPEVQMVEPEPAEELQEVGEEKTGLHCHYCNGAISVAVEEYENFHGRVEDVFGGVEVKTPSKHQKHRKPLCRACSN